MKTLFICLTLFCTLSISCSSLKKTTNPSENTKMVADGDGSSYEKAIFIHQDHETQGVDAEYAWIRAKYPGSKVKSQALANYKNKPYDILNIVTADGTPLAVYFDISNFFGKF